MTFDLSLTCPVTSIFKKMHALESSRQGLSNAVCRLSLRCVVLEISAGAKMAPPNRARCSADSNGSRVNQFVGATHQEDVSWPHSHGLERVERPLEARRGAVAGYGAGIKLLLYAVCAHSVISCQTEYITVCTSSTYICFMFHVYVSTSSTYT